MYQQYLSVQKLEVSLGSPNDKNNLFSHQNILELDEQSLFPTKQAEALDQLNFSRSFVPKSLGGDLHSFEELVLKFKSIFRRDPSLGLGYGATSYMGSIAAMMWGNDEIKLQVANTLLQKKTISIAYHEKEHGNDVLHNEVTGKVSGNLIKLSGEKWVINNAKDSAGLTVFCKTSESCGAKAYSLVYVDKKQVNLSTVQYLDKIHTLGVRGCKIAGLRFDNTEIKNSSVISSLGSGFDITLKAFQITRATIPGMSIGIVDTALRMVLRFSLKRSLYKEKIIQFPQVNETLVNAYINILLCDCISTMASRALHVVPEQMSIISSIAKFYIPKRLQSTLDELSVVLGARHYVRDGEYGLFQKLLRDYPVIALGHASDVICANTILPQLNSLLQKLKISNSTKENLDNIFDLQSALPIFQPEKLRLSNLGYNDIINSLPQFEAYLVDKISNHDIPSNLKENIFYAITQIKIVLPKLEATIKQSSIKVQNFSSQLYNCVGKYCQIHIALSCIYFWLNNIGKISAYFDEGLWLMLALNAINKDFLSIDKDKLLVLQKKTLENLIDLDSKNKSFSLVPINYL
jgi:alkylation response protein AidB-like acyl-CoA dehydrogenase